MMLLGGGTENDMHSSVFRNQVGWAADAAVLCHAVLTVAATVQMA
jgi:hypothetical protein